jgi:hypothetical protein
VRDADGPVAEGPDLPLAEVLLDGKVEARTIRIVGTGKPMPEGEGIYLAYIGTVQMLPYVWHIYEELPEEEENFVPDRDDFGGYEA